MAVAEIIGAAVGVLMLVIVAYMLVGSVLTTAEVVTSAQTDHTLLQEARLGTSISVNRSRAETNISGQVLNFNVTNTGNVIISDFTHMDVYTWDGTPTGYRRYSYSPSCVGTDTWCKNSIVPDMIHPHQLDPGEKMWACATYTDTNLVWFQVTTGNGVNAQTTYP
jgi:flagellar protein FlaF